MAEPSEISKLKMMISQFRVSELTVRPYSALKVCPNRILVASTVTKQAEDWS